MTSNIEKVTRRHQLTSTATLRGAVRGVLGCRPLPIWGGFVAAGLALAGAPATAGVFPAEVELSSLTVVGGGDGADGFVLPGLSRDDRAGASVSRIGDLNGDALEDFAIAATGAGERRGIIYVVFGRDTMLDGRFPAEFDLSSLAAGDGSIGFALLGFNDRGNIGVVRPAGDVNGDGLDDLIIGAPRVTQGVNSSAGQSYVVFGRDTSLSGPFPSEFDLWDLVTGDGSAGFVMRGVEEFGNAGASVAAAGDINGDGLDDLIVGGPGGGELNEGETYVVFGRDTAQEGLFPAEFELSSLALGDGSTGFMLDGIGLADYSGRSVSAAGDVNGDGIADIMIAADSAAVDMQVDAGEVYVVFGRDTGEVGMFPAHFELSSLAVGDGTEGFVLAGTDTSDRTSLPAALGDVNGDGVDDISVATSSGDPGGREDAGVSYVIFGRNTAQTGPFPAQIALSSLLPEFGGNGEAGFVVNGIDPGDGAAGLARAGDVNGDGIGDLLIGARDAQPNGLLAAGEVYVIFGRSASPTGNFPVEFELSSLLPGEGGDGTDGFAIIAIDAGDAAGEARAAAGDINGDGIGDLIIGASGGRPQDMFGAGEAYVLFGRIDSDQDGLHDGTDNCTEVANPDQFDSNADGFGNVCDGDLNFDCAVDFGDLEVMKSAFFTSFGDADLDGDGVVNFPDLFILKQGMFVPPGPSGEPNHCVGS